MSPSVATNISELRTEPRMRFLRVCLGSEAGEPGMTVYEVDHKGWVHRQIQLSAEGTRFAPEDILMCSPVNTDAMLGHPAAEEMDETEFELLWAELSVERTFCDRIPDPDIAWHGHADVYGRGYELQWLPYGAGPAGWERVPGFTRLYAKGDRANARTTCAALFVAPSITWTALAIAA